LLRQLECLLRLVKDVFLRFLAECLFALLHRDLIKKRLLIYGLLRLLECRIVRLRLLVSLLFR